MPRKQRAEGAEPGQWGGLGAIFDMTGRAGPGQEQTGAESGRQGGRTASCLRLTPGSCCSRPLGTWGPGDLAEARGRDSGGTGLSAVLITGSEARTLHLGDGGTFLLEPLLGGLQSPLVLDFVP